MRKFEYYMSYKNTTALTGVIHTNNLSLWLILSVLKFRLERNIRYMYLHAP